MVGSYKIRLYCGLVVRTGYLVNSVNAAGVEENPLGECRFAGVDVSRDANVAHFRYVTGACGGRRAQLPRFCCCCCGEA